MASKRPPNSTETLPDGTEIDFYDEVGVDGEPQQRRYLVNGTRFVNVTTILNILAKEALLSWVERLTREGKNWRDVRDDAGKRGHGAHHLLLQLLTGTGASLADLDEEWRAWGQAGFKWIHARSPEVAESERMIASCAHQYAGRLDLIAGIDGIRTLADFKTITRWSYKSKDGALTNEKYPPYDENLLQLDLYQGALVECGFEPAEQGLIVRLGPDAEYDETFVELDPQRGIGVLAAYRAKARATAELRKAAKVAHNKRETERQIAEAVEAS